MRPAVVVDLHKGRITVGDPSGSSDSQLEADVTVGSSRDLSEALDELLGSVRPPPGTQVSVRFHPPIAQFRTLRDLPPLNQRDLALLVSSQAHRFFRLAADGCAVGATWDHDDRLGPVAKAAAIDGTLLTSVEDVIARAGLVLVSIQAVAESLPEPIPISTPGLIRRARSRARLRAVALLLVGATGWAVSATTYVTDLVRDDREILAELGALQPSLDQLARVEARVSAFDSIVQAVQRQSSGDTAITRRMSALSRGLPRDAHLHSMEVSRDGSVRVVAHVEDPVALVRSLSPWWPGQVRIEGTTEGSDGAMATIVLGAKP